MESFTFGEVLAIVVTAFAVAAVFFGLRISMGQQWTKQEACFLAIENRCKAIEKWIDDSARAELTDLHKWHNVVDDDGVKLWYVRKSFEESVRDVARNTGELTAATKAIAESNKQLVEAIKAFGETQQLLLAEVRRN